MPSITSNILFIIFYSSTIPEFVRIARSTLLLKDFLSLALAFNRHPQASHKYHIMASDIVSKNKYQKCFC